MKLIALILLFALPLFAQMPQIASIVPDTNYYVNVTLSWNPCTNAIRNGATNTYIDGYCLYYGTNSGKYFEMDVVDGLTNASFTYSNLLDDGTTKYFSAATWLANYGQSALCPEAHYPRPFLYTGIKLSAVKGHWASATNFVTDSKLMSYPEISSSGQQWFFAIDSNRNIIATMLPLNQTAAFATWGAFNNWTSPAAANGLAITATNHYGN